MKKPCVPLYNSGYTCWNSPSNSDFYSHHPWWDHNWCGRYKTNWSVTPYSLTIVLKLAEVGTRTPSNLLLFVLRAFQECSTTISINVSVFDCNYELSTITKRLKAFQSIILLFKNYPHWMYSILLAWAEWIFRGRCAASIEFCYI